MQQLLTPLIVPVLPGADPRTMSWAILSTYPHLAHLHLEHPNVSWFDPGEESFSIDDVRTLQEQLGYSAYKDQTRLAVLLKADSASLPAQNALLKVLEEPPVNTQLALVVTHPEALLPTVLSRCVVIQSARGESSNQLAELPVQLVTLLTKPEAIPHHELLQLSDNYGERGEAIGLLEAMLTHCQQSQEQSGPTPQSVRQLQILLDGLAWLKSNVNVKLALGECWFELKKA